MIHEEVVRSSRFVGTSPKLPLPALLADETRPSEPRAVAPAEPEWDEVDLDNIPCTD
jgi:hypothetical protein